VEAPVSDHAAPTLGKKWLDRLPGAERDALIGIGRRGRGLFGRARFQRIFDENLTMFEHLAGLGATAAIISQLLEAVGIVRDDGTALPEGTVSSALSRARERAGRGAAPALLTPAGTGREMQAVAGDRRSLQANAGGTIGPAVQPSLPSFNIQAAPVRGDHRFRPTPKEPAAGSGLPEHTRRAAALLEDLRSEQDEGSY
jgi:hypothetical protein